MPLWKAHGTASRSRAGRCRHQLCQLNRLLDAVRRTQAAYIDARIARVDRLVLRTLIVNGVFLAGMELSRFTAASRVCDVMLDSIEWSGGNTTLESLAQDLPVVTVETALMRGRVSGGMLRMMGLPETVAGSVDDYVALAVRMARDAEFRAAIKSRVARDKNRLYRDHASIAALEDFIERAVRGR